MFWKARRWVWDADWGNTKTSKEMHTCVNIDILGLKQTLDKSFNRSTTSLAYSRAKDVNKQIPSAPLMNPTNRFVYACGCFHFPTKLNVK